MSSHVGAFRATDVRVTRSQGLNRLKLVWSGVILAIAGCSGATVSTQPHPSDVELSAQPAAVTPATVAVTPGASTATPTAGPVTDLLTGGRYMFSAGGVPIEATGPDGWVGYPSWALDGPKPVRADAPTGIGISFFTANGLYSDPCHWDVAGTGGADVGDVAVGPTVDDLVTALRANTFYTSSAARQLTIDGYTGQELELQLPDDPFTECDNETGDDFGHAFVFSGSGLYAQGPANRWHLYILDVEGTRLIAVILSYEGTPQADLDTAQDVIDTLDFSP
jgi:hypothetical protein